MPRISDKDMEKVKALWKKIDPKGTNRSSWKYAVDSWLVHIGQMPGVKFGKNRKDPYIEYGIVKPAKRRTASKTKKK